MSDEAIHPDDMDRTSDYYPGVMDATRHAMDVLADAFKGTSSPMVEPALERLAWLLAVTEDRRRAWFISHLVMDPPQERQR